MDKHHLVSESPDFKALSEENLGTILDFILLGVQFRVAAPVNGWRYYDVCNCGPFLFHDDDEARAVDAISRLTHTADPRTHLTPDFVPVRAFLAWTAARRVMQMIKKGKLGCLVIDGHLGDGQALHYVARQSLTALAVNSRAVWAEDLPDLLERYAAGDDPVINACLSVNA